MMRRLTAPSPWSFLTLTVSPYAAALLLTASISFCYGTENKLLRRWLIREAPLFLLLAFLPKIWQWVGGEEPSGFFAKVKPMYDKYIRNYIHDADVIVANGGKNARIVDILAGYVQDELGKAIHE